MRMRLRDEKTTTEYSVTPYQDITQTHTYHTFTAEVPHETYRFTVELEHAASNNIPIDLQEWELEWGVIINLDGADIKDGSIPQSALGFNVVTEEGSTFELTDGIITTRYLASRAVTHAKLGLDSVWANNIVNDAIGPEHIQNHAVRLDNMELDSVDSGVLKNDAVTTAKIVNNAVTEAKIVDNAITQAKLKDDSVGTAEIIDLNVTGDKVADDAIEAKHIADDQIDKEHLDPNIYASHHEAHQGTDETALMTPSATKFALDTINLWFEETGDYDGTVLGTAVNDSKLYHINPIQAFASIGEGDANLSLTFEITVLSLGTPNDRMRVLCVGTDGTVLATTDYQEAPDSATKLTFTTTSLPPNPRTFRVRLEKEGTQTHNISLGTYKIRYGLNAEFSGGGVGLTDGAVYDRHVNASADIDGSKLKDDTITAGKIKANAITTAKVASKAITQAKVADDAIGRDQVASGLKASNTEIEQAQNDTGFITPKGLDFRLGQSTAEVTKTGDFLSDIINHADPKEDTGEIYTVTIAQRLISALKSEDNHADPKEDTGEIYTVTIAQ